MLLYNDKPVVTVSLKVALLGMLEGMKSLTNNKIMMYGHNSKAFDCVHFINASVMTNVYITEFHKVIAGFADTLPFYRQIMHERKQTSVQSGSVVS